MRQLVFTRTWFSMAVVFVSLLIFSSHASAFINGSRVIGFGARSVSQGGVDIAVADDSTGINSNPACQFRQFLNGRGHAVCLVDDCSMAAETTAVILSFI